MNQIWTIGHSTRKIDIFISLLQENGIKLVADVRLLPGSKRYPQFNKETLTQSLGEHGIRYEHFPQLGGRRKPQPGSKNNAWRNEAFRGYVDLAHEAGPTAIMCAESLWWRCHRALISDFLKARGVEITHIVDLAKIQLHPFTSAAQIVEGKLSYAADSLL